MCRTAVIPHTKITTKRPTTIGNGEVCPENKVTLITMLNTT
jgi:hypothetical protein